MTMLREIFWWSAILSFRVTCAHIPGKVNLIADVAFRLQFNKIPPTYTVSKARQLLPHEQASIKKLSSILVIVGLRAPAIPRFLR